MSSLSSGTRKQSGDNSNHKTKRARLFEPSKAEQSEGNMEPMAVEAVMIDVEDFGRINEAMQAYDEKREKVIKDSRDVQKLSKQAIFSLHRGDFDDAKKKLDRAQELAKKLSTLIADDATLRYGGSYSSALEEWAEGVIFRVFLLEGRIPTLGELPLCERDEYLGGILDFAGELNRFAVARATARDTAAVKRCAVLVDRLMACFLQFDFRNGGLRRKFDALKYTLKKMENTLYELSLTERLGFSASREDVPDAPEAAGGKEDADAA